MKKIVVAMVIVSGLAFGSDVADTTGTVKTVKAVESKVKAVESSVSKVKAVKSSVDKVNPSTSITKQAGSVGIVDPAKTPKPVKPVL